MSETWIAQAVLELTRFSEWLTSCIFSKSQLSAHNSCFPVIPPYVTDCLPLFILTHLHTTFKLVVPISHQSNSIPLTLSWMGSLVAIKIPVLHESSPLESLGRCDKTIIPNSMIETAQSIFFLVALWWSMLANSLKGRRQSAHITGCIMPSGWWVGLDVANPLQVCCYHLRQTIVHNVEFFFLDGIERAHIQSKFNPNILPLRANII